MLQVITKTPAFYLFRWLGFPKRLPLSLTLSVTYRCNSRCKTCAIYTKKCQEFSLEEWKKTFKNFGKGIFWATISGGEPFLREDLNELVCSLYDHCRPAIINIPTNGLLHEKIPQVVGRIANHCRQSKIIVNVSLDEINERHDAIRCAQDSFTKARDTFLALKSLNIANLSVGIHTVISKFNVRRIPEIYSHLHGFQPDSYISEIAEERKELETVGKDIAPAYEDYAEAIDYLIKKLKDDHFNRIGNITRAFRIEYYKMVKRILRQKRQVIPCYAGFASAQIAPDGDVWMCCIKAESIGNLRDSAYDFRKIWFSEKARSLRKDIKSGKCYCPLANASYTNMLFDARSLIKVGGNYLVLRKAQRNHAAR